ncbi:hypothetical protein [Vibrio celticus]|uniref:Uncharacterized protein n=1 Tax=Vibrio celticus TaxID=446372 RepID=A0A1C3JGT1_9VIBR|nr:hypothetical protein [Vibrio celticus]SBT14277.1 hypothetical protein VCE7224_03039 [Vibrio celticus]
MNIKTSISLFILMMVSSFSVYSQPISYMLFGEKQFASSPQSGADSLLNTYCSYSPSRRKYQGLTSVSVSSSKFTIRSIFYEDEGCTGAVSSPGSFSINFIYESCPNGQEVSDLTQSCEAVCDPPSILNPHTSECYTPAFCDRESTNDSLFEAEQSCAAKGGIFSHQCSDFLESLETRCTQSDKCAIGFPDWPDCIQDLDPTDDITPPSGGFNPGSGSTANPDAPTFDKPEPDDVTPTDTTDEAVLEAIQNSNRDSNEGFKALSTDLNNGFTDINNSLSNLNATNTAIGESVVEQMNQDYQIYQANKDLALQQTGAITAGASSITDALGAQTGALTGALGEQTSALTDALGELAAKLPEQCDPTEDNNYCQYPHGLGSEFISDTFGQMDNQVGGIISGGESLIESTLQSVIDSPLNDENESIMNNATAVLLNALGFNESCSPLTFEANGNTYSIDCYVSEKIKLILSFLIGMYTLMTLTDILLDGITPIGRKPSATRYA